MEDLKVLGEFYFSQLLNKPIRDAKGRRIGRLLDMAIRWDNVSPHVTGIRYTKGVHDLIPIKFVASLDHDGMHLNTTFNPLRTCPLHEDETFIGKWLLDKQIIDLEGSRLVRVNDISLSWVSHEDHKYLVLVAVDIGVRGLFRRLGVEFFLSRIENKFVGCQYIKPLENRTSALQLTREKNNFVNFILQISQTLLKTWTINNGLLSSMLLIHNKPSMHWLRWNWMSRLK